MDPHNVQQAGNLGSPAGSRVHLPSLLSGASSSSSTSEGILNALGSPPLTGTSSGFDASMKGNEAVQKREVFSDLRRLVSFGLRRETAPP